MKIGFLAIGDEILQGKIQDANGPWLARFLRPWNLALQACATAGDGEEQIRAALDHLYGGCDLVVCSGGLGPTPDDVTKQALGNYFGKLIHPSPEARACAEAHYRRMGRELPEGHGYGYLPEGFAPLSNPSGFAPGLHFTSGGKSLLAAPGVPKEFRDMLEAHFPRFAETQGLPVVKLLNFRTQGVAEEKIFGTLCPGLWEALSRFGQVSSLPHPLSVDVGIALRGTREQVERAESEARALVSASPLAPHVWHVGHESLEEVIVTKAAARVLKIAFAESCTGGLCSHRITNVPGSSQVFLGGVVSYDNAVKTSFLGVREETLRTHGAVSEACAREMARGLRERTGADIAVSLTGIAGPGGGSAEKPVGTLWVGVATVDGDQARIFTFKGDRESLKTRFSQAGLFLLHDSLRSPSVT